MTVNDGTERHAILPGGGEVLHLNLLIAGGGEMEERGEPERNYSGTSLI